MRITTFLSLILISANFFSQSSQIDIDWFGEEQYNIGNLSLIVPNSKNFKTNNSYGDYYKIVKQWKSDKIIDESSVEISNIIYSDIDMIYQFSNGIHLGFSIKNVFETQAPTYPLSPKIPRYFLFETGFSFK